MTQQVKSAKEHLTYGDSIIQQLSIDCIIFGFHENQLKVLAIKWDNLDCWVMPGGFVFKNESLDTAANRILANRTGLTNIYMEQFSVFGDAERHFEKTHQIYMEAHGFAFDPSHWVCQRFVSIGYYALVDVNKVTLSPNRTAEDYHWFDIDHIPNLQFDHTAIFQKALETLRQNLDTKLVGFNLLPETFTMQELQNLYETILGKKLIRSNFQRKMLSLEILERVDKKFSGGAHKAPYLYRLRMGN